MTQSASSVSLRPSRNGHCQNHQADRTLGEYWEDELVRIARLFGWEAWAFSRKKGSTFTDEKNQRYISPDVWMLRRGAVQYACEVKHKNPTAQGMYGLEVYRADGLVLLGEKYQNEFGRVLPLYVIHDWTNNGNRDSKRNVLDDWVCESIFALQPYISGTHNGATYYHESVVTRPINYYEAARFQPLKKWLL